MSDDSTDTAPAPADQSAGTPAPAAAPTTPAVNLDSVLAENKRLEGERNKAIERAREAQKWGTQASQRAAALERQLQERGFADTDEPAPSRANYDAEVAADLAEVKFKLNNPDWNKVVDKQSGRTVWDEMNAILFDDAQANDHAGRTPYLTLKNIYREVQYRRLMADQKARGAAPAPSRSAIANTISALQAQAEFSGQGASTPVPTLDITDPNMTDDQLIDAANKAGLLDDLVDPNDPPSFLRR